MKSDKEIALELINWLETLYLREIVYQAVLNETSKCDWRSAVEQAEKNQKYQAVVHERFEPLRQQVLDAPDLSAVVRAMLEGLPRTDQGETG